MGSNIEQNSTREPFTAAMLLVSESRFVYFCLLCLYLRQVWSISARDKNTSQFSSLFNTEHWQVQLWKNAHDSFWRRNIFLVLDAQGSQIYSAEATITQINCLFFVIATYKLLLTEGLIKFWVIVLLGKCLPSADFGEDSSGKKRTHISVFHLLTAFAYTCDQSWV